MKMGKYVIETVQTVKRKYYVETDDLPRAVDVIDNVEIGEYSSTFYSEDVSNITKVEQFPSVDPTTEMVNAAVVTICQGEVSTRAEWGI